MSTAPRPWPALMWATAPWPRRPPAPFCSSSTNAVPAGPRPASAALPGYGRRRRPPPGQADEFADVSERFYLLEDAHAEYQQHTWTVDLPTCPSSRAPELLPATCPTPYVDHCGNCGTTVAIEGWTIAPLGFSCPDCYDVMSGEPGRHNLRYHRQR
ncbi:hypothetical protein ACIP93_32575 [Streptomyces sp. NPDC088745]|uniref:hypothetical protein n=1 Tax=Streptomyces sp. NPDC088745 TaxID=3365884 RepID=UPI003826BDE9